MISKFLNKPLSEEVISLITEQCTFKGMMKNVQSFTLGDKIEGPKFLCKGVVGNWKEHFTPELNQRFEKEVLAKLKGSGLEFDFELWHTIFCNALMTVLIKMIVFEFLTKTSSEAWKVEVLSPISWCRTCRFHQSDCIGYHLFPLVMVQNFASSYTASYHNCFISLNTPFAVYYEKIRIHLR